MILYLVPCTFCGVEVRLRDVPELTFCTPECAQAWREERREWIRLRQKVNR